MSLRVRCWGTRGSIASPGPATVRYGGNTPCVEVRAASGALTILDAGTGIRELGRALLLDGDAPREADIYLTHAHWDHIQGLPFFGPLFRPGFHFRIRAAREFGERIERALRVQMATEVFPVPLEEVRAELQFHPLDDGESSSRELRVDAIPVRHPGGALGYRLTPGNVRGGALVYIPDNELSPDAPYDAPADWRVRLVEFVAGAGALLHDAMYTAAEQRAHRGWGHSSVDEAVELALDGDVRRLVLFHHHPERGDDELDRLLAHACALARRRAGGRLEVAAAIEGDWLTI